MTAAASGYVLSLTQIGMLVGLGAILGWFAIGWIISLVRKIFLKLTITHLGLFVVGALGLKTLLPGLVERALDLVPLLSP